MSSIAIITARGGSKRIPRKNVKPFCGKPIILYSIEAALQSGVFDEVMVSTDDEEIADIAVKSGASVPFMRSEATASDHATTAQVIEEVLVRYSEKGQHFDTFCCIYPTAPFISAALLLKAMNKLADSGSHTLVPVVKYGYPVWRSVKMDDNQEIHFNWPENLNVRSQDLPPVYHDAGQFYAGKTELFLQEKKLFTEHTLGLEIPESETQDIDTEEDWLLAEIKYRFIQERKKKD
jgi:N-acylneuraminate cytidylyltransferase